MLRYNTQLPILVLPEYGRNIQMMVEHCMSLDDRDMRNDCARVIIDSMANLFPEFRNDGEEHKLWNHLAIMSGFRLDIDYPCEIINPDDLHSAPASVAYPGSVSRYRHYGALIPRMINQALNMEEGYDKSLFISYIANQMKKMLLSGNPEAADDERVYRDIYDMSQGQIVADAENTPLLSYIVPVTATGKKKRKK